jgi:hypothetical protein
VWTGDPTRRIATKSRPQAKKDLKEIGWTKGREWRSSRGGGSALRLCTLGAQSPDNAQGRIRARAGANLENGNPDVLLQSIIRFFAFLPEKERQAFVEQMHGEAM